MVKKTYKAPTNEEHRERWDHLFHSINNGDDLACAVVAASYVDSVLARLLMNRFVESSAAGDLLNPIGGALGTLVARARTAYCIGLIRKEDRLNIEGIATVRNRFAHNIGEITFADSEVHAACDTLTSPLTSLPHHLERLNATETRARCRAKFIEAAIHLCMRLEVVSLGVKHITPPDSSADVVVDL